MDLANDGLPLKESGKIKIANNFINGLNRTLWNEEAREIKLQNKTSKLSDTKSDLSKNNETQSENEQNDGTEWDFNKFRLTNVNNIIVVILNINSLTGKLDQSNLLITNKIDILALTKKTGRNFSVIQIPYTWIFGTLETRQKPKRWRYLDIVRNGILPNLLTKYNFPDDIEGLFIELNLKKTKWLFLGTYHPPF